jgi:hypothetical protein
MITFVTFKWRQPGYPTLYEAAHVNGWYRAMRHYYRGPARFVVVTDDAADIDRGVECVPLWRDHATLGNPHGSEFPSCYRRLRLFARDAAALVGAEQFVVCDLDVMPTQEITPLFERREDFVIWRDPMAPRQPYNGGLWMLRAGARPQVWERFEGQASINAARAAGRVGSDQAWIAHALGASEAVWTRDAGVLSYKRDVLARKLNPATGRLVMFHGRQHKPWTVRADWCARWY